MSQCTVPAPAARASVASAEPPVAMTTPGRAKRSRQNETELSAKSIQVGCVSGSPHESAVGAVEPELGAARSARTAAPTARKALPTAITGTRSPRRTETPVIRRLRRVELFGVFGRRRLELGRIAVDVERALVELEIERVEVEAVAVADLFERREQLGLGLRPGERDRKRLRGLDRDLPVLLETRRRRDELPDDDVLLQAVQTIDLALDGRVREHLRGLLERGR